MRLQCIIWRTPSTQIEFRYAQVAMRFRRGGRLGYSCQIIFSAADVGANSR
jgi:hypothetical protein